MKTPLMIFDLDGTISDPKDGIVRCFNHALSEHGYEVLPEADLVRFIGPPLDHGFSEITGLGQGPELAALVQTYRDRYGTIGYAENQLYSGMTETLASLAAEGIELGVCSSKRVDFVQQILDMFELAHLFRFVSGGELGVPKWRQLGQLKLDENIPDEAMMIGDRHFDLVAARKNNLTPIGVLWGYGSAGELTAESPAHLLEQPGDLLRVAGVI